MLSGIRKLVRDKLAQRLRVPSVESCLRQLQSVRYSPKGVYDVGAYQGDFAAEILKVWPNTVVTCFEPLPKMAENLRSLQSASNGRIKYEPKLLGERNAELVDFHVGETASSILEHTAESQYPVVQLPMTTLDDYSKAQGRQPCSLLKLDVQGYELSVLKGGQSLIRSEVEVILLELNLLEIYKGVPLLHEVVHWLFQQNFVTYDIGGLIRRPADNALWQADFVFVQADGPLRQNKKWS